MSEKVLPTRIDPQVEKFLTAARNREISSCLSMLKEDLALLNSVEAGGYCALHFAAFNGDLVMMKSLLEFKPEIDMKNFDENTPLMMAAKVKQHDAIRLLVEAGANINFMGKGGAQAAHHAASMGNPETLAVLKELGANFSTDASESGTVLHWGCHSGSVRCVGALLYDFHMPINVQDAHGGTPLFTAIFMKQSELVQFLLEHGADPTIPSADGTTPLHIAVEHATLDDVKNLLAFGADPTAKDSDGQTPQKIAEEKGKKESLKELLKPRPSKEKKLEDAARFKICGNKVFGEGESIKAAKFYTLAISLDAKNHAYFSNRSACHFNCRNFEAALLDACRCLFLNPQFVRGYFRKAATLHQMKQESRALEAVMGGLKLDPKNVELLTLQEEIRKQAK